MGGGPWVAEGSPSKGLEGPRTLSTVSFPLPGLRGKSFALPCSYHNVLPSREA